MLSVPGFFAALAVAPAFGAVSYHDLAGGYTPSSYVTGPTSADQNGANGTYALVDYDTGLPTGTSLTVSDVINHSNGGTWALNGDAATLFPGSDVINYSNMNYLGNPGTHTYTFTGLTAGLIYDVAIYADRNYAPDHANAGRSATFTLGGASSFINTSSTGNAGVLSIDGASVTLQNGSNSWGNVARWSDIVVDESGTITITITGNGYSGNVLRLESAIIPEPASAAMAGIGALGLLLRRRSRQA